MCEKTGTHWDNFVIWARDNGIEFRHPEDFEPWWHCWYNAVKSTVATHKDENIPTTGVEVA